MSSEIGIDLRFNTAPDGSRQILLGGVDITRWLTDIEITASASGPTVAEIRIFVSVNQGVDRSNLPDLIAIRDDLREDVRTGRAHRGEGG